ncbi:MAG TPA: tetratricopeptide repeat protein [Candidatus Acidoferrales bacterium]|nr:tetratricopeptide repeat protein [Candidatus Acidoferrales bacterium]
MKPENLPCCLAACTSMWLVTEAADAMDANLGQFLYSKEQQIGNFSDTITNKIPGIVWRFYNAARLEDWDTASNLFIKINAASLRYNTATNDEAITPALATVIWQPLCESYGACDQFHEWNNRWLHRFGNEIINSIPPGSIYFGGTDPGRFVVSALCESQVAGKPFFTVTQNQLVDGTYLDYLRAMYGKKIKVPTVDDSQRAFQDYVADASRRQEKGQLKPGEDVRMVNGRVQVSGQVAVMEVNGLIAKDIFTENPSREFYVEQSFPLDWMYPYLTPHGPIFQLNNKPVSHLADVEVLRNQRYWERLTDEMLGHWLTEKTSLQEVCDFSYKYGLGRQLDGYPGDKDFAANDQARKSFSKLRSSLAGLYAWRAQNAGTEEERNRLNDAADFAYRQSYALYPCSLEAIYGYASSLVSRRRTEDAVLLVKTTLRLTPEDEQLRNLLSQLEKQP